jgi:hypothetical protein
MHMTQNIIALTIVFLAAGYTIFSIVRSLTAKKTSHCSGCAGCSMKGMPMAKPVKGMQKTIIQANKLTLVNNKIA